MRHCACSAELRQRGLTVEGVLGSTNQQLLADLDRWLLYHVIDTMPFGTRNIYLYGAETLHNTATHRGDVLNVSSVGTWP